MQLIYSPHYNIDVMGLEAQHPFDVQKFGKAWALLEKEFGTRLIDYLVEVRKPIEWQSLKLVHDQDYLDSLKTSGEIAVVVGIAELRYLPPEVLNEMLLTPIRWATMGTVEGAIHAMNEGLAVNLGGGYHHARRYKGDGFCFFSDIALAVAILRKTGHLAATEQIAYVDLDAHQGDGVCDYFMEDDCVRIFDMFNEHNYPNDEEAQRRIDYPVALPGGTESSEYMSQLTNHFPKFIKDCEAIQPIKFAIYNAGTDVFEGDELGGLKVSERDILKRDLFVINELRKRNIPTLMVLSGGYSGESHRFIATTIANLIKAE